MRRKLSSSFLQIFIIAAAFLISCSEQNANQTVRHASAKYPKYVFLFIGDGMGFAHIAATEAYLTAQNSDKTQKAVIPFTQFPAAGQVTTHSANSDVTCSAAAGTALASGIKANNGTLNITPHGDTVKSITYDLKKQGYKIGIATSVSIDHATPAAFYANEISRENHYSISTQIAPSNFDFFAGSGLLHPMGKNEKGEDENIYDRIFRAGYAIVRTEADLTNVKTQPSQKVLMVQGFSHNPRGLVRTIDRTGNDGWTLADFTRTGIELLTLSNDKGFFFMIEGGQIDWESHNNNAPGMIHEMIDFSQSVDIAVEFYNKYPNETLIIVTADHETGGLLANSNSTNYKWTTGNHTGVPVPVFAIGAGSELFNGKIDNTDIAITIKNLMIRKVGNPVGLKKVV